MNPNHVALGLSTNCVTCHTTAPNWSPALFPVHNNYYPLVGAHAAIASNCTECHNNGNYNNTQTHVMVAMHQNIILQTIRTTFQLDFTTCASCHSQNAWEPSTWDHDDLYFPIYSGKHKNKWDQCSDCHTNATNYSIFSCLGCHPQALQIMITMV